MAAGACFYPNASHKANRSFQGARGPGNLNGLGERERRSGVTGHLRPGTWVYPRQPIKREQLGQRVRRAA